MSITANVTGGSVSATVSGRGVSASVPAAEPPRASVSGGGVSASVSGGVGPQGPAGAAGDVTVPAGLSNLSDVSLAGLADGDLLRYSASRWRNFREDILVDGGNFVVLLAILSIR